MGVSNKLRFEILRRDNYTCRYCGASAPDARLEVDHVVPRALGGRDIPANLVTACERCNNGKSAMLPEEWLRREIEAAARQWAHGDDGEDDLADMAAYQDALYALEDLPSAVVLHYIAQAFLAAMPYRPTHDELVRCAGMMAQRDTAAAPCPDNQLAKQLASDVLGKEEATWWQQVTPDGAPCP